jgi:predicted methyltransferase
MDREQEQRFSSMRELLSVAGDALGTIQQALDTELEVVNHDSPRQAASLQRIQETAGTAVDALQQVSELARHARSYQAQRHQEHSGRTPH